jgi:hypothetical protein
MGSVGCAVWIGGGLNRDVRTLLATLPFGEMKQIKQELGGTMWAITGISSSYKGASSLIQEVFKEN